MKSVGSSFLSYTPAMLFYRLTGLVQGLLVIRWMEPTALGLWLQLQLITIYGPLVHLGLFNAINRQIPFLRGRNEDALARRAENVVRGVLALLLLAGGLVLVGMYALDVPADDRGRGVFALIFTALMMLGVQFQLGLFRARHEFGRAGAVNAINALAVLAGLPLVYSMGYDGLLWRAAAVASATLVFSLALNRWDLGMEFDWGATARLLRIGFPIMTVGMGMVVFSSLDRTLIAWLLDEEAMGQYALCFAVAKVLALFPLTIGQIYYTRMTELYASEGVTRHLVSRCVRASLMSAAIVGTLAGGAFVVVPTLVEQFFPKYVGGIAALRITLVAYFLLALAAGPIYYLITTVQKRRQLGALLAGILVMTACAYAWSDSGLVGIAWSLVSGSAVYVFGLWAIVLASSQHVLRTAA